MRLRRSYSTPSDTRPATSRRVDAEQEPQERRRRRLAPASGQRFVVAVADVVDRAAHEVRDRHAHAHREAASTKEQITPVR